MKALEQCARCGKCLPHCPSFQATRKEALSPRGRVALLQKGLGGEALSHCLLCGACEHICPNSLPLLEAFIRNKPREKLATFLEIAFQGVQKTRPALKEKDFHGREIVFFLGCGAKVLYPQETGHFLNLFPAAREKISLLSEPCCGLPHLAMGDLEGFYRQARQILSILDLIKGRYLLTLCASCLFTFRKLYPLFLEEFPSEIQIEDGIAYLLRLGASFSNPGEVFFQVPCHLRHLKKEPWWRKLLYFEGCCGQAGTFGFRYPEEALEISRPLRKALSLSGARFLATSCSSCLLSLKRNFPHLKPLHIAAFLKF